jgi:outer membrane protein OmpA-like peptidoglycan-associated protein
MSMKKNRGFKFLIVWLCVTIALFQTGCKTMNNTAKAGAIGAGAGGIIGGIIGHNTDNTVVGAIIGSAVGGTAGALIGRHMDKQAEELKRDLKGAEVQRVGEGILITFNSGLQFDSNSSELTPGTRTNLNALSTILKKYDDTAIVIEGHTDNVGEARYNQTLSEKRAYRVESYLATQSISTSRVTAKGFGEQQPLNGNLNETERQINRRVEVAIYANNKMKKLAKKGELEVSQ